MGGFTLIYAFSSASQLGEPPETPEFLMLPQDQTPIIEKNGGGSEGKKKSCPEFNEVSAPRHLQKAHTTMGGPLIGDGSKPRSVRWLWS